MKFNCVKCGQEVTGADTDSELHKSRGWRCPLCYTVIADCMTRQNHGTLTYFSPADGLGDQIVQSCVFNYYQANYPLEKCIQLKYADLGDDSENIKPLIERADVGKIFWSSSTCRVRAPISKKVIHFDVAREAVVLESMGVYPRLSDDFFSEEQEFIDTVRLGKRYIALSVRNITKAAFKNAEPHFLNRLYLYFDSLVACGIIDHVVIVGNDDKFGDVWDPPYVIDLRKKLKINHIASIFKDAVLTVGRDNGLLHLAAAAGSKVVGWGYEQLSWKPKAPPGQVEILMKEKSNPPAIVDLINSMLNLTFKKGNLNEASAVWNRLEVLPRVPVHCEA